MTTVNDSQGTKKRTSDYSNKGTIEEHAPNSFSLYMTKEYKSTSSNVMNKKQTRRSVVYF